MSHFTRRVIALKNAKEKAKNPEFKKLWDQKLKELLAKAGGSNVTIQ